MWSAGRARWGLIDGVLFVGLRFEGFRRADGVELDVRGVHAENEVRKMMMVDLFVGL
jgi:hypothetical protein